MRVIWTGCCSSPAPSSSLLAPGLRRSIVSCWSVRKWGEDEVPRRSPAVAPAAGGSGDRIVDRRRFIAGAVAVVAAPLAGEGQQPEKVWRVGYLGNTPLTDPVSAGFF